MTYLNILYIKDTQQVSIMDVFFKLQKRCVSGEVQLSSNACWEVRKYADHVCLETNLMSSVKSQQ